MTEVGPAAITVISGYVSTAGMTDLEFWCFACITFTFGSLISYVIILFTLGCPPSRSQVRTEGAAPGDLRKKMFGQSEPDRERRATAGQRNNVLELILFTITAGAFALFNIIYWSGRI